jgi:hypothetical protein
MILSAGDCKDFVVDTGFEDQQPTDDFSRWYQRMNVVGPYVFGGNSWGVDVLTKKNGAWTKIHVPESGNGVEWAAGPDKDGNYWFAATGTTGNPGLFKGQGQNWGLVADAPLAYGYSRMVFAPDGTLYALAGDGQARLRKRGYACRGRSNGSRNKRRGRNFVNRDKNTNERTGNRTLIFH